MKIAKKRGRTAINGLAVFLFLIFGRCFTSDALLSPRGRLPSSPLLARVESGQSDSRPIDPTQSSAPIPFRASRNQNKRYGTWLAASPSLLGFNRETLETTVNRIGRMKGVYSVILARNGYLIAEQYFREGYRTKPHNMKSASKSVLSALVGIAMDEGVLSLDLPISDILPAGKELNDPRKADITVKHLLTMTTGLKATSYQAYSSWVLNGDWVKAALDQPLVADPGTHFQYSTGNTHLLSAVLTAATGMSTKEYAIQKLFGPMDITIHGWDTDPKGIYQGGNNLLLVPRDMARIGQLYLDGGKYRGHQLVPKPWVEESTRAGSFGKNDVYGSYGYLWFCRPGDNDAFVAVGFGGQYIYASRQHESVIAVTATLESKGRVWEKHLFDLIHEGIFGSIESDPRPVLRLAGQKGVDPLQDRGSLRAIGGGTNKDSGVPRLYPISQTTRNVILRRRPSQQSRRLGLVPAGTRIDILDTQGQWHQIQFNDRKGWLFSPYVNTFISEKPDSLAEAAGLIAYESNEPKPLSKTPSGDPDSPPIAAMVSEAGLAAVRLNLRTGPSQTDSIIRILSAGTPLKLKEKIGSWYRVRVGQFDGWVFADYVQILPEKVRMLAEKPGEVTEASPEEKQPPIPAPSRKKITIGDLHQVPAETQEDMRETVARLETRLLLSEKAQEQLGETLKSLQEEEISSQAESARAESDRESEMSELVKTREVLEDQRRVTRAAEAAHKALLAEMDGVKTQIVALKEALRRGRSNRDNQKTELLEFNQEMQAQQTAASLAVTERRRLSAILTRSQKQIDSLQTSLKEFLTESRIAREKLRDELSTVTTALEEQGRLAVVERVGSEERESELEAMRGQIRDLGAALKTAQNARGQMEKEMTILRKDLETQQDVNTRTERERDGLKTALASAQKQTESLQTALKGSVTESRIARENLRDELSTVTTALEEQERLDVLESVGSEERESELEAMRGQIRDLGAALKTAQNARGQMEKEMTILRKDLETQQDVNTRTERERDGLKTALASAQKQTESLQTALKGSVTESRIARENLRDELSTVTTALEEQERLAAVERVGSEERESELEGMQGQIRALGENLAVALKTTQRDRDRLTSEMALLRQDLKAQQNKDIRKEMAGLQAQIAALNDETLERMESLREDQETSLLALGRKIKTQQAAAALSEADRKRLGMAVIASQNRIESLQTALAESLAESAAARGNLRDELSLAQTALKKQLQEAHLSEKNSKALAAALDGTNTLIAALKETVMAMKAGRETANAALSAATREQINSLQTVFAEALLESGTAREKMSDELAMVRVALEKQIQAERQSDADRKELAGALDVAGFRIAALNERVLGMDSGRDTINTALAAQNQDLQRQKETDLLSKSERELMRTEIAAATKQMGELRKNLTEALAEREVLKGELEAVQQELKDQHQTNEQSKATRKSLISEQVWVRTQLSELGDEIRAPRSAPQQPIAEEPGKSKDRKLLDDFIAGASRERTRLETELAATQERVEELQLSMAESREIRKDQDSKWNEVHHAIEAQRKSATVSESARSELKVDLAAASNQIEALQTLLKASQTKQNSLAEEVSTVKTTLENQHKDALTSETDRASLLSEIDGVRTRTVALGETLGQIRSIRDNQKAEISELNRELQILKKDKVQIDSVNKALVAELDTVKKQMKDQEAALVNSQAFREEQTLERAEARKQRGALQTSLKESRTGQDTLVAELLTIKKELRSQKLAAHRAEAAGMELETRLTAYNNQILTLKAKVASLQASPKRISKPAAGPSIDSQKPKEPSTDPVRMAGAGREPTLSRTQGEQNLLPRSSPKFDIIDAFARSWADSWQSKDIKAYLAHYSEDFQPGGGANLTSWTQQRRKRLLKPAFIEIELRSIRHKKVGATRALVTFDQRYRSDTYADRSAKTLELRWEREGWKILKETSH